MQFNSDKIEEYLCKKGLSQKELSELSKVSQSTVSRCINRTSKGHGKQTKRLFIFIHKELYGEIPETGHAIKRVIEVFEKHWGKSEKNAEAMIKIMEGLGELCSPTKTK